MELSNTFTLPAPIDECWDVLTDLERVASCVPGFTPGGWDDDTYTGTIKVKVGAVAVTYDARIKLIERDDVAHHATISAEGRERRGQGQANAMMRSRLTQIEGGTEVSMVADVDVTGRVAGFGRGILADVSSRLVGRFANNVETTFLRPQTEPAPGRDTGAASPGVLESTPADTPSRAPMPAPTPTSPPASNEPLDLVSLAAGPTLRRLAPVIGVLGALCILWRRAR